MCYVGVVGECVLKAISHASQSSPHMRNMTCVALKPSCRSRWAPEGLSGLTVTGPGVGGGLLAMAAVIVPPTLSDLLANRVFMAGFLAWFLAQFGKVGSLKKVEMAWREILCPCGIQIQIRPLYLLSRRQASDCRIPSTDRRSLESFCVCGD